MLCTRTQHSAVSQLYFKNKLKIKKKKEKLKAKEIIFVVTRGWREGELDEGGEKAQTSSYKINKVLGM